MAFSFDNLITVEKLLRHVSEEDIYYRYLGQYPAFGQRFINPLPGRPSLDRNGDCKFFYGSNGRLLFKDWAWKTFDVIGVAMQYYGLDYYPALRQVAEDFGVLKNAGSMVITRQPDVQYVPLTKPNKGYTPIQVKIKAWNKPDLAFWQLPDRVVTIEELQRGRIFPVSAFWLDGWLGGDNLTCSFAYQLGPVDMFQVYRPKVKNKRYKFRQSSSSWLIGLSSLTRAGYVLVTKSFKDAFLLRLLGFNVCCVLSETMNYQPYQVDRLNSYGKVVLLYDNDKPGITAATERAEKHDWQYITYPAEVGKDSWACGQVMGSGWVKDYLEERLAL